jgi:hypothetical protein
VIPEQFIAKIAAGAVEQTAERRVGAEYRAVRPQVGEAER